MVNKLIRKLLTGRRMRVALLAFAILHLGWGLTVALGVKAADAGDAVLYEILPIPVRMGLWFGFGTLVGIGAFWKKWESVAWGLAMVMPVERALGHFWAFLMWAVPGAPPGSALSLVYFVRWTALVVIIYACSGLVEKKLPTVGIYSGRR